MAELKLGIAGCGRIVESGYLPALRRVPELDLVALADPVERRLDGARALASKSLPGGAPAGFSSVESMLARAGLDALVVATPSQLHAEHAQRAAARGLATLVEKPPAGTLAGALRIAALEPAPWIAMNRRFSRLARLRAPDSGSARVVVRLAYRRPSWGAYVVRDDALGDLGSHAIDLATAHAGQAGAVSARAVAPERAELRIECRRGEADIAVRTDAPWRELVEVRDAAGGRVAASRLGGPLGALTARLRRDHPLVESLAGQLRAFARAAAGGDPGALASAREGAALMAVIDAARRSAAAGGAPVAVAPVTREAATSPATAGAPGPPA